MIKEDFPKYGYNSDGSIVYPENANKKQSYYCPNCRTKLTLKIGIHTNKDGYKEKTHFSHKFNLICNEKVLETIYHKDAKKCIEEKNREEDLLRKKRDEAILKKAYLDKILKTHREELVLRTYKAEEILKNKVLEIKKDNYKGININVIKSLKYKINYEEFFNSSDVNIKLSIEKILCVAKENNIILPKKFFRPIYTTCYNCKKEIMRYDWPKHPYLKKYYYEYLDIPNTIKLYVSEENLGYGVQYCQFCNKRVYDVLLHGDMERCNVCLDPCVYTKYGNKLGYDIKTHIQSDMCFVGEDKFKEDIKKLAQIYYNYYIKYESCGV